MSCLLTQQMSWLLKQQMSRLQTADVLSADTAAISAGQVGLAGQAAYKEGPWMVIGWRAAPLDY